MHRRPNLITTTSIVLSILILSSVFGYRLALSAPEDGFAPLVKKIGPAVREVIDRPTLYRVTELKGLPCTKETFEFLIDRPRVSMALARMLDPTLDDYRIGTRPDGSYHVDDNGKLVGDMEVVTKEPGRRVYYISGYWKFILGIRFSGRMVLVPEYSETVVDGVKTVDARARGYMKIDSVVAGAMARLAMFLFPGKVDSRMARFASAVRTVAASVDGDPEGVYRKLARVKGVSPEELDEFKRTFVLAKIHRR